MDNNQDSLMQDITKSAGRKVADAGRGIAKKGLKLLGKGLKHVGLSVIKALGPYALLLLVIPIVIYLVYYMVTEIKVQDFTKDISIQVSSTDTESIINYIDGLSDIELARFRSQYDINLKILRQYMELENETVEKDAEADIKLTTSIKTTNNGYVIRNDTNTINHSKTTLEKEQASYAYRLWWQLLAGIDIYINQSHLDESLTWDRIVPKTAKKYLLPEYTWSKPGEYTREVTNKSEVVVINKVDGSVTSETVTVREDKYIYPLSYLEKVKTAFGEYTFNYTKKVTTTEHQWGEYVTVEGPIEYHESSTPSGYYYTKNPKTGVWEPDHTRPYYDTWTTQTITKTRYSKQYQVDENLLMGEPEFEVNLDSFKSFLLESRLEKSNMADLYDIIKSLPNSYECVEMFTLALSEMGVLDKLDEPSILLARPVDLDINLPTVTGKYSRNDLVNTAKSLLGVPYFWGGKYDKIGVDPKWGSLQTVTSTGSWSTGKSIPYGLDCSGFITWAFNQILIPEGKEFPHGTQNQYVSAMLLPVKENELRPGDIGYTRGIDHVGMYIGEIDGIPSFIHAGGRLYSSAGKPAGQIVISHNNVSTYYDGNAPTKFVKYFRLVYKFRGE